MFGLGGGGGFNLGNFVRGFGTGFGQQDDSQMFSGLGALLAHRNNQQPQPPQPPSPTEGSGSHSFLGGPLFGLLGQHPLMAISPLGYALSKLFK